MTLYKYPFLYHYLNLIHIFKVYINIALDSTDNTINGIQYLQHFRLWLLKKKVYDVKRVILTWQEKDEVGYLLNNYPKNYNLAKNYELI